MAVIHPFSSLHVAWYLLGIAYRPTLFVNASMAYHRDDVNYTVSKMQ